MQPNVKKLCVPLAQALRNRRKALGLTQEQLAKFAACSVPYIYLLENGKATIRLDKLITVLTILGLQLKLEAGKDGLKIDEKLR